MDERRHPLSARGGQFRAAVEHSNAGYFFMDLEGKYRWVNQAWLRMHGYTDTAQILGKHYSVAQVDGDLAEAEEGIRRVLAGQPVMAGDFRRRLADGSVGHHTFTAHPVVLDGEVVGMEGFLIDRTAYRNLEQLHQLLFKQMADGFCLFEQVSDVAGRTVDFRQLDANPAMASLAGRAIESITGLTITELFADFGAEAVEKGRTVLASGTPVHYQVRRSRPSQFLEIQLFRVGETRLAMLLRDVTKREQAEAALLDNDKLLRDTQELAGLGSYVLDIPSGRWTSSEVLDRLFGIDEEYDRTVENWLALVHPEFRSIAADHLANDVLSDKKRFDLEYQIVRISDGQVLWVHGLGELRFGPSGEPVRMIGTIQDISERKRTELDQEQSLAFLRLLNRANDLEELLRSVTEYLQAITEMESVAVRLWEDGRFHHLHAAGLPESWLCPREGYPTDGRECLCGLVLRGAEDEGLAPCIRNRVTAEGCFWSNRAAEDFSQRDGLCEGVVLRPGCPLPLFQSVALIPMRFAGRTLGLVQLGDRRADRIDERRIPSLERRVASLAIAVEQRIVQMALRENEERYRMISENTGDVIWLYDLEAEHFAYMSPSAERLTGLTVEDSVKRDLRQVLSPQSYEYVSRKLAIRRAAVEAGDLSAVHSSDEVELVCADGRLVDAEVVTTLLRDARGCVNRILGVSRDITERKLAEARLMQAQKMESVGRLAGGVAHDFNNQLTVINGYSQLMLSTMPADSPLRSHVEQIYAAGERAASLTRQLLAFSRKQMLNLQPLNLNQVVLTLQPMLTRLVGEDVEVRVTPHSGAAVVRADLHQIEQVVMNLAVNARDAMPGGGLLAIEVSGVEWAEPLLAEHPDARAGQFVRLSVRDTGMGMDEATRSRIFEPFFTTKEVGKGTGLGLSMVQGVVSQCDGFIEVLSEPGEGTTFEIFLPTVATAAGANGVASGGVAPSGHETVMVVEDQPAVREYAVQVLSSFGYNVICAASADEALEIVRSTSEPVQLLVTDVVMPGMDGVELAGRLRRRYPGLKCLYMSGYSGSAISERGPADVLGQFIQKPFSPEQLAVKVRSVLSS